MADVKIAIKDEGSAKEWLSKVMLTNEEYRDAMQEAGTVLQEAKDFGEGTLVDEFYNLGTNLLNATQKVFDTLNEISTIVNNVLGKLNIFKQGAKGVIDAAKNIFG